MKLYFGTDPDWIDALRVWAESDERIGRVWIFGSRATGQRTAKADPSACPDLDVGYVITGDDEAEQLGHAHSMAESWRSLLAQRIIVPVDLQYAEPARDKRVWPAISDHGVLVFSRT